MALSEREVDILNHFRESWKSTGGRKLSILDACFTKEEVYQLAVENAYAPSTQRAMKSYETCRKLTNEEIIKQKRAKREAVPKLIEALYALFSTDNLDFNSFAEWEKNICDIIRSIFKNDNGISQYTYGNAQKWVNMAIKYILSSNLFLGDELPFKVCFVPIDGIVQKNAHNLCYENEANVIEKVNYLSNENEHGVIHGNDKTIHSWGKCDNWDNIKNYQDKLRKATEKAGYYSPLFWEIETWQRE